MKITIRCANTMVSKAYITGSLAEKFISNIVMVCKETPAKDPKKKTYIITEDRKWGVENSWITLWKGDIIVLE